MTEKELAAGAAQALERLLESRPLVHHITNFVVINGASRLADGARIRELADGG